MGKHHETCPNLLVHDNTMESVDAEKYLGDYLMKDGSNKMNIQARVALGIGIISQIMLMIEEICVGAHTIEAGIMLRDAMFVNAVLFNSDQIKSNQIKLYFL